jgi:hypothetical protein
MQCEWILAVLNQQREQGLAVVEAKQEEEDRWRKQVLDLANMTLAIHTNSWYGVSPSMIAELALTVLSRYMYVNSVQIIAHLIDLMVT